MFVTEALTEYVQSLETQRLALVEKHKKSIWWHVLLPFLVGLAAFFYTKLPPVTIFATGISAIISAIVYFVNIGTPFQELKSQLKAAILEDLMATFHPEVAFSYDSSKQDVKNITRNTGFFRANRYREEDVIRGHYGDTEFYISEIHLSRKKKKSRVTVFDGLLFKIMLPDKSFPRTKIQSRLGLLSHFFGGYEENKADGFHYDTEDQSRFDETLSDLFPFFKYLIETNRDVRVSIEGNEMVLFLDSDMKFLDDPEPRLKEPLLNNLYVSRTAQQLNSLLFIVESLANNLDSKQIEERLELKVLEYARQTRS